LYDETTAVVAALPGKLTLNNHAASLDLVYSPFQNNIKCYLYKYALQKKSGLTRVSTPKPAKTNIRLILIYLLHTLTHAATRRKSKCNRNELFPTQPLYSI